MVLFFSIVVLPIKEGQDGGILAKTHMGVQRGGYHGRGYNLSLREGGQLVTDYI